MSSLNAPTATFFLPSLLTITYSPAALTYTLSPFLLWALVLVANPFTHIIAALIGTLAYLIILSRRMEALEAEKRAVLQLFNSGIAGVMWRVEAGLAGLRMELLGGLEAAGRLHDGKIGELVRLVDDTTDDLRASLEAQIEQSRRLAAFDLDAAAAQCEREFASLASLSRLEHVLHLHEGILASLEANVETARLLLRGGEEDDEELRLGEDVEAFWPVVGSQDEGSEGSEGLGAAPAVVGIDVGECVRVCEGWIGGLPDVEDMEGWEEEQGV